jgi:enoyl-CoA hydratase
VSDIVTTRTEGDVFIITFDDGKANALSHLAITALDAALTQAEEDGARALLIAGRPGRFCAGFDLSVMQAGPDAARELVAAGARFLLRLYMFGAPVVLACTGHAMAGGAVFLMAADHVIGTDGEFKIGLNEVQIGMPLPVFAMELARARLSPAHLNAATQLARLYSPREAVEAGYLHQVVAPTQLQEQSLGLATVLAGALSPAAFKGTRQRLRGAVAAHVESTLTEDLAGFSVG